MLQFNELRTTEDGKYLIIDVEVQNLDFYNDVYIETLKLTTFSSADKYDPTNPKEFGGNTICLWRDFSVVPLEGETYLEVGDEDTTYRHLRKCIEIETIQDNLFFVFATNSSEFAEDTPCSCQKTSLFGITYNKNILYRNSINALSTLNSCTPSKELIDYILNEKAFEYAIKSGDYKNAINYWNNTFKNKRTVVSNHCGCHGY